jgi:hypothetical protein
MNPRDIATVAPWLRVGASFEDVNNAARFGLLDNARFSTDAVSLYNAIWAWSTFRFSGSAGRAQERYVEKRGIEALKARFERVRAYALRLQGGGV